MPGPMGGRLVRWGWMMAAIRWSFAILLGVLLLGSRPARAQQWAERDFDLRRNTASGRPLLNIYWVSLPLLPAIPDMADSGTSLLNSCVGDPDGPPTGDGRIDADDLICAWWTARANLATAGTFTVSRVRPERCTLDFRSATVTLGQIRFAGVPFPVEQGAGYRVDITRRHLDPSNPRNHATITGDHDPSFPGRPIVAAPNCLPGQVVDCCHATVGRLNLVSVPYHSIYTRAFEILCGLEGVDWRDDDGDGWPDACWDDLDADGGWDPGESPTGIYDGEHGIAVNYFNNTEAVNAPVSASVSAGTGGVPRFAGTNFALVPGEGYLISMDLRHSGTLLLPDVP